MREKYRLGLIELSEAQWMMFGEQINRTLAEDGGEIIDIRHVVKGNGQIGKQQAVVLTHPEFEEVEASPNSPIPRYRCEFFTNQDGSIQHTKMIRIDQHDSLTNKASA